MARKGATKRPPRDDCNMRLTRFNIISPSYPAYHNGSRTSSFTHFSRHSLITKHEPRYFLSFFSHFPTLYRYHKYNKMRPRNCSKYPPTQLYNMACAQIILLLPSTPF
jgi:hypothetical protein